MCFGTKAKTASKPPLFMWKTWADSIYPPRLGTEKCIIERKTAWHFWSDVWDSAEGDAERWHYSEDRET